MGLARLALAGLAVAIVALEVRRPLRRPAREPKLRRMERNAAVGAIAAITIRTCEYPIVLPLARLVERRRWGLLPRLPCPPAVRAVAALLALDYTLYVWHVLTHRVPALWRFHAVHHADLDMDATTAIRFHFAELLVSVPWRAAQVALIGVPPRLLELWQTITLMSVVFHHSNVRLSPHAERRLAALVVTPRLHGIHHSRVPAEANSNWSSGLTLWDRLHGTLSSDMEVDGVVLGVDGFDTPGDVTLPRLLAAPFTRAASGPGTARA